MTASVQCWVELLVELFDALDPPTVLEVEMFALGSLDCELVALEDGPVKVVTDSLKSGGHGVDVVGGLVVLVAAAAGQAAQTGGGGPLVLPVAQTSLPIGQVTLAAPNGGVGLGDVVADVGRTAAQVGSMDVLFGAQVGVDAVGVVHRREGFGLGSGQRGGDLLGRVPCGSPTSRPPWSPSSRDWPVVFQVWVGAMERDWPT